MGLSEICMEHLQREKECQEKLFKYIDAYESVIFNAGAGSGKTYALVECLKYIISCYRDNLKNHNQKIACITYTNVAAKHIRQQLGASDIVEISTIHDRIWSIISNQKSALLKLHVERLENEIEKISDTLNSNPKYRSYQVLNKISQESFLQIMLENKCNYNRVYNKSAKEFKTVMSEILNPNYTILLSNANVFKEIVDKLYKRKRYLDCLEKIKNGEKNYRTVYYDAMYNRDRLDKMRISHDTLLKYGYELFKRYPKMRQLVIDKYPYILIDEYQDTAEEVVMIMNIINQYAKEIKHNIFIAYFGDSVQNIYETGVGNRIFQLHSGLSTVTKIYNRRSYTEVIDIANNIRGDNITQKSIYIDSTGGSAKFYYGQEQDVSKFIKFYAQKWNVQIENPLHCLFSTNRMVAEYSGFANLYTAFKNAEVYRGSGYNQLNTELMSHDIIRLGKSQALLYRLMKLYTDVRNQMHPLRDIFPNGEYRNMSYSELKYILAQLQSLNGNTLDELLKDITNKYNLIRNKTFKYIIERTFDVDEDISYDGILKFLLTSLYKSWDETDEVRTAIVDFLNIKIDELINWFQYIDRKEKRNIHYHTFHSTKGLEFENVVIILGKDFGTEKGAFEKFFKDYGDKSSIDEMGRNILYVAVTRAIKNLRIFYTDNLDDIRDNVEKVFGKVNGFTYDIS